MNFIIATQSAVITTIAATPQDAVKLVLWNPSAVKDDGTVSYGPGRKLHATVVRVAQAEEEL